MAMTILVAGCLHHPDQTIFCFPASICICLVPKRRDIGWQMGLAPLVFCLQKSCRGFEHSYTFVLSSVNDSDTDSKWLLKTFAVWFFGMSAEVERCPFVNTFRARHTDAILLLCSVSFWILFFFWGGEGGGGGLFSQDCLLYFLIFCIQGNIFLSLVCLSLPLFPWCLC